MGGEVTKEKNTEKTKCNSLQDCIFTNLDLVEAEILKHQKAIEELETLYVSLVHTLKSPFVSKGDLSQRHLSTDLHQSPEAESSGREED